MTLVSVSASSKYLIPLDPPQNIPTAEELRAPVGATQWDTPQHLKQRTLPSERLMNPEDDSVEQNKLSTGKETET